MLPLALPTSLSYSLRLVITSLVELFNSSTRLEAIQINKALCSVHWLPALLSYEELILRLTPDLFPLIISFSYIQDQ